MLDISDIDISFQFDDLKIKVITIGYGVFLHPFPKHSHGSRFYEAHLVCGGNGTLIADGQEYHLSGGTLYMTGPHITHEQLTDSMDPMDEYYIQFKITEGKRGKSGRSAEILKNTDFWIGKDTQNMIHLFERLTEEDEKKELGYLKSVINLTSQILISLARNYAGSEKATNYSKITPDDKRMKIVDDIFLYRYSAITLDELCKHLNLSHRQTQRFLKKNYGKTFIELRTEARLNKAEELMKSGKTPAEAAAAVGYEGARSILKNKTDKNNRV